MTSRSTSLTQRPPSSSSIHQLRSNHPTLSTAASTVTTSYRHLGQHAPRKPPSAVPPPAPRRPHRTRDRSPPPTFYDGAGDAAQTEAEEDIIISGPTYLFGGQGNASMPEKLLSPGRPEQSRMSEPMALLMAHNAALQRADAAVDPMTNAAAAMTTAQSGDWAGYSSAVPALGAGLGSPVPGQTGSEAAIETFKRRMRERQAQVDVAEFDSEEQEVLKRALWDSLRRRVEGLREDNWMFEVEGGEGRVEVG